MASTYLGLQSEIGDAANRDDLFDDVTAYSPAVISGLVKRCISDATMGIQRDLVSRGGHKNMETVSDALVTVSGTETVTLPSDFAGHRALLILSSGGSYTPLDFVDPTSLYSQFPSAGTGFPQKFTITGTRTARLRPVADGAYSLRLIYYQALTALSTSATNWVLDYNSDVYVSRAMWRLSLLLENNDRAAFWKQDYDILMNDLMGDDRNIRWAGVPVNLNLTVPIA